MSITKRRPLLSIGLAAFAGLASLVCACDDGRAPAKAPSASKWKGIVRYYPFEPGMQWSYMVHGPPGTPGLLKIDRVLAFDGTTALIQSQDTQRAYRVAPDGIVREPSGTYLLKWPIALGDRWPGAKGATVEVTKVDAKVSVEAGTFEGCVETTETTLGDEAGILRTTFCPDVGPVTIEIQQTNAPPGEVPARLVGRLRAFGPPITLTDSASSSSAP